MRMTYLKDRWIKRGYQAHVCVEQSFAMFAARKVTLACFSRILSRDYHGLCRPLKRCCLVARTPSFRNGLESFHAGIERYTVGFVVGPHTIYTSADTDSSDNRPWEER